MNDISAEKAFGEFGCERCTEADCPVKREEAAPETCCVFLENEAPLRLRDFVRKYCGAFGPESVIIPAAYHVLSAEYSGETEAVGVSPSSTAKPCELKVKVFALAKESLAESCGSVAIRGKENSFLPETPLGSLPFDIPIKFDENNEVSFKINNIPFIFSAETPFSELLRTVNEDSEAMVTMELKTDSGCVFSIRSDATGSESLLSLANSRGVFFGDESCTKIPEGVYQTGRSASFEINGEKFESAENEALYKGITVFLNRQTEGAGTGVVLRRDYEATSRILSRFIDELGEISSGLARSRNFRQRELSGKLIESVSFQTGGTGCSAEIMGLLSIEGDRIYSRPEAIVSALKDDAAALERLFTNNARGLDMGLAYKVKEHMERYLSYWKAEQKPDQSEKTVSDEIKTLVEKYKDRLFKSDK